MKIRAYQITAHREEVCVCYQDMTIAIEPMVNQGVHTVETLSDGWTAVTADGKLSAHFEHTIAITPDGPVILTLPD